MIKAPTAGRSALTTVAGLLWSLVGLVLIVVALFWFLQLHTSMLVAVALALGVIAGLAAYRFKFTPFAVKNIARIAALTPDQQRVSIFAIQSPRNYLLVVFMMGLGYTLRHLPIPRLYLAPLYLAIGLGLLLASLHFYAARTG